MFSFSFSLLLPQNSTLTIEEFHSKLQEATNFPLRPFVVPFLKVDIQIYNDYKAVSCLYVSQTRIWKAFRHSRSRCAHLSSRYSFPFSALAFIFQQIYSSVFFPFLFNTKFNALSFSLYFSSSIKDYFLKTNKHVRIEFCLHVGEKQIDI